MRDLRIRFLWRQTGSLFQGAQPRLMVEEPLQDVANRLFQHEPALSPEVEQLFDGIGGQVVS